MTSKAHAARMVMHTHAALETALATGCYGEARLQVRLLGAYLDEYIELADAECRETERAAE